MPATLDLSTREGLTLKNKRTTKTKKNPEGVKLESKQKTLSRKQNTNLPVIANHIVSPSTRDGPKLGNQRKIKTKKQNTNHPISASHIVDHCFRRELTKTTKQKMDHPGYVNLYAN